MTENTTRKSQFEDYESIDLLQLFQALWQKAWLLIIAGIIVAAATFSWSTFVITPQYSATVMLYVNNSTINVASTSFSISASDISASQSLVKTYIVILKNRTTLNQVLEKTGLNYSYSQIYDMITAASVDNTQVFHITVTCENAENAAVLANTIAEVLPLRVADIIDGSSMRLVDEAVVSPKKVSPNITKNTALGFIVGMIIAAAVVVVLELLDDVIHSDDYILQNFSEPVLAKIPDLYERPSSRRYGYYSYYAQPEKGKKSGKKDSKKDKEAKK